jgi:hypothetical protein
VSYVAAVVLMHGVRIDDSDEGAGVRAVNAYFGERPGLAHVTDYAGGTKHMQCELAAGGINYLDVPEFLAYCRRIDWSALDIGWAQVAIKDENDEGFTMHEVWRE